MIMTHATTPDEVIARIADWQGKDVRWEPLGGGHQNYSHIVTVNGGPGQPGGGKYVLRVPGLGTDAFIDRQRERRNHGAAAAVGVTPPLLYVLEPEGCTVVPFIEGETMHPTTLAGHEERLAKVVDLVKTYHQKATFTNAIHVFDMIRHYMGMAHQVGAFLPADIADLLAIDDEIEQAMERDKPRPVACHNDLLSENFILDRDGKMWLIDWEYSGMADPYFDLGDFCVEHPLTRAEEQFIITRYCGQMRPDRLSRMLLYKIVADLWWSIWAFIQQRVSQIDFDFYGYGMSRLERLRSNLNDPDYRRWIATV